MTTHKRHLHDFYPTPVAHVEASLDLLDGITPRRIVDPGAGTGVWGTAARRRWPDAHISGYELRNLPQPAAYDAWFVADYLNKPTWADLDLVIGNPPYSMAEQFVRRALGRVIEGGYVLMLLRLGFLEGRARHAGLWQQHPPRIVGVFGDRPSFSGNGRSDASAYAAFVWRRREGWQGDTVLRFIESARVVVPVEAEQEVLL